MKRGVGRAPGGKEIPGAVARGTGLSLAVSLAMGGLAAAALSKQWLPEDSVEYVAAAILIGGTCCGAWVGGRQVPDHRLQVCFSIAGAYFAILLVLGALCFGGRFRGIAVTAALILGTAGGVALLSTGRKKGRRREYKRFGL